MTVYEPVTDIGKAIAKALTKDDGIRLDVHDILEAWEPEYIAEMKKAEKYDELPPHSDGKTYLRWKWRAERTEQKLEAVKTACNEMKDNITKTGKPPNASQLVVWSIAEAILKILEA